MSNTDYDSEDFESKLKTMFESPEGKQLADTISSVFLQPITEGNEGNANQTEEYKQAILDFKELFRYCILHHHDALTLSLSRIVRSYPYMPIVKTFSLCLLYSLFYKNPSLKFSTDTIYHLKQSLLPCLQQQFLTPVFPIVSKVISLLAWHVFKFRHTSPVGVWPEYLDYVHSMTDHPAQFKKGIWLVLNLPLNIPRRIYKFYEGKIETNLLHYLDSHHDEDVWILTFATCFTVMSLVGEGDVSERLMNKVKSSVTILMNRRKQDFVQKGINLLGYYVAKQDWWIYPGFGHLYQILKFIGNIDCIDKETRDMVNQRLQDGA